MLSARQLLFTGPRKVTLADVSLPDPEPGQLLVRTRFSGISAGTELLAYRGRLDPALARDETLGAFGGTFAYPFSYGYSCVGRVERGTAAIPDGTTVFAFHPHQDLFVVGERDAVVLDDTLDPRVATMFPLVETALQLSLDAGAVHREVAVVVGLGPVGLLTALLLARAGGRVLAAEPRADRRAVAAALGIDARPPELLASGVDELTGGRGVPLLVELSGSPPALADALVLLAHEGTALVGSWYGTQPVLLPLGGAFHRRRLTIRSSQVSSIPAALGARWDIGRRRATVRRLLAELPLHALPAREFPFEEAAAAFAALDAGEAGLVHVALRHGGDEDLQAEAV
ncbi:MAG: zinc-binding dehydrogenase [Mycobacteriaceae bacterium]